MNANCQRCVRSVKMQHRVITSQSNKDYGFMLNLLDRDKPELDLFDLI